MQKIIVYFLHSSRILFFYRSHPCAMLPLGWIVDENEQNDNGTRADNDNGYGKGANGDTIVAAKDDNDNISCHAERNEKDASKDPSLQVTIGMTTLARLHRSARK
jgi:hypothetical protein